jgi:hypothetical protein
LSTRIKSVGKTKISHFFKLRYRKTVPIINRFIGLLDENIEFKYEISETCMKANLLQMEGTQEAVRSGLNKLKEQSWLSNSEFELFSRAISHSFR